MMSGGKYKKDLSKIKIAWKHTYLILFSVVSKYCIDNMICLEDGDPSVGEFKLAGLLASHLVGQVLDEAYIIANAAMESGENNAMLEGLGYRFSLILSHKNYVS